MCRIPPLYSLFTLVLNIVVILWRPRAGWWGVLMKAGPDWLQVTEPPQPIEGKGGIYWESLRELKAKRYS